MAGTTQQRQEQREALRRSTWRAAREAELAAASSGGRLRSPRALVGTRIGRYPVRTAQGTGAGQAAIEHARGVWSDALSGVSWRADRLWDAVGTGGDQAARFGGQVDLAFLATVAGHLESCSRCWLTWTGGGVPGELLTRAVRSRPVLATVFGVITREAATQRRRPARRLVP